MTRTGPPISALTLDAINADALRILVDHPEAAEYGDLDQLTALIIAVGNVTRELASYTRAVEHGIDANRGQIVRTAVTVAAIAALLVEGIEGSLSPRARADADRDAQASDR